MARYPWTPLIYPYSPVFPTLRRSRCSGILNICHCALCTQRSGFDIAYCLEKWLMLYTTTLQTLPSIVNKEQNNSPTEETSLLCDCQNPNYGAESSQCVTKTPHRDSSILSVFTGPLLVVFLNQIFLTFLDMSHSVLIPLMYSTSMSLGGLGLDPFHIGVILGGFGCVNSVIQARYLGHFIRKCGAKKVYSIAFSSLFFCFFMYPITSYFARRAGGLDGYVAACIFVQLAFQTMIYMAYGEVPSSYM